MASSLDDALAAGDLTLTDDVLDRIDEVVAPGLDVSGVDHLTGDPSLAVEHRRRPLPRPT